MEEYKLALLADEGNAMAWNSLGVCMAALGRQHEARRHFLEALKHSPDETRAAQICYNLGTVCQTLGERRAAARYYRQWRQNCSRTISLPISAWASSASRAADAARHDAFTKRAGRH